MGALAVVVPLAASPALGSLHLDAIPFSHGSGTGPGTATGSGGTGDAAGVGALNLIDNMRAVLTSQSGLTMFTATTHTPTYWQVATLSHFTGVSWLPDPATQAAADNTQQFIEELPITPVVPPSPAPSPPTSPSVTSAATSSPSPRHRLGR